MNLSTQEEIEYFIILVLFRNLLVLREVYIALA